MATYSNGAPTGTWHNLGHFALDLPYFWHMHHTVCTTEWHILYNVAKRSVAALWAMFRSCRDGHQRDYCADCKGRWRISEIATNCSTDLAPVPVLCRYHSRYRTPLSIWVLLWICNILNVTWTDTFPSIPERNILHRVVLLNQRNPENYHCYVPAHSWLRFDLVLFINFICI